MLNVLDEHRRNNEEDGAAHSSLPVARRLVRPRPYIYIVDAKQMQPASIVITLSNLQALGSPKTQL